MIYIINITENFETDRGKRHINLIKFFNKKNIPSKIISGNFDHSNRKKLLNKNTQYQELINLLSYSNNISIKRLINHIYFSIRIFFKLLPCSRNDIILVSSIPSELPFCMAILKKIKKFNLYIDVRDVWPDSLPIQKNNILKKIFFQYCNLQNVVSLKSADKIFYSNPDFKNFLERYNVKGILIPLGFDESRFKEISQSELKSKSGAVYIGNLNKSFNLEIFKDSEITKNSISIIGEGDLKEYYKNIYKNGFFYGKVSYNLVPSILKKYKYGLLPITGKATLPNKAYDYYASGLDIITNSEATAKMLSNNNFEIFENRLFLIRNKSIDKLLMITYRQVNELFYKNIYE